MTSFRVRPRFRQETSLEVEAVKERIQSRLHQPDCPCQGYIVPGFHTHITLKIPKQEQHYWSPQLHLTLEAKAEGGTLIRGLYGPNPSVWGMFAFGYGVLIALFTFTAIIGFSLWSLKMDTTILWFLPIIVVLLAGLYMVAQFGQKLGAEQTFALHHFYEETLGERAVVN